MIFDLPAKKPKRDLKEWHVIWCLVPRKIDNKLVWLSRIERRLVGVQEMYDGSMDMPYRVKVWEYRLIN